MKIKLFWSKRNKDWTFNYPDNAGKTLMGIFFEMVKTTGHRCDFKRELKDMLNDHGYDYKTLKITCDKLKPATGE